MEWEVCEILTEKPRPTANVGGGKIQYIYKEMAGVLAAR